jgi:hypothetical protein
LIDLKTIASQGESGQIGTATNAMVRVCEFSFSVNLRRMKTLSSR